MLISSPHWGLGPSTEILSPILIRQGPPLFGALVSALWISLPHNDFEFILGRRNRVALADEDGDSDLDEKFGKLIVRFVHYILPFLEGHL